MHKPTSGSKTVAQVQADFNLPGFKFRIRGNYGRGAKHLYVDDMPGLLDKYKLEPRRCQFIHIGDNDYAVRVYQGPKRYTELPPSPPEDVAERIVQLYERYGSYCNGPTFIMALLPRHGQPKYCTWAARVNAVLKERCHQLTRLHGSRQRLYFLSCPSPLYLDAGVLGDKPGYHYEGGEVHTPDGVHLNLKGYAMYYRTIRKKLAGNV